MVLNIDDILSILIYNNVIRRKHNGEKEVRKL